MTEAITPDVISTMAVTFSAMAAVGIQRVLKHFVPDYKEMTKEQKGIIAVVIAVVVAIGLYVTQIASANLMGGWMLLQAVVGGATMAHLGMNLVEKKITE